jgi:hypothetical protein
MAEIELDTLLTTKRIYKVNDSSKLSAKAIKVAKAAKAAYKNDANFYYKVRNGKLYCIKRSALMLIKIFKEMSDINKNIGVCEDSAVILEEINIDGKYKLNTYEVIEFVNNYLLLWQDNPTQADYITDVVQTSNVEQIIQSNDLKLINDYVNNYVLHCYDTSMQKKQAQLKSLHLLVKNIDGYLRINSLTKKLHAYIACILWSCSMKDIHIALNC